MVPATRAGVGLDFERHQETSPIHGLLCQPRSPAVRSDLQGFRGSTKQCAQAFSGASLGGCRRQAVAEGPQVYLTLGFCIRGGAV